MGRSYEKERAFGSVGLQVDAGKSAHLKSAEWDISSWILQSDTAREQ